MQNSEIGQAKFGCDFGCGFALCQQVKALLFNCTQFNFDYGFVVPSKAFLSDVVQIELDRKPDSELGQKLARFAGRIRVAISLRNTDEKYKYSVAYLDGYDINLGKSQISEFPEILHTEELIKSRQIEAECVERLPALNGQLYQRTSLIAVKLSAHSLQVFGELRVYDRTGLF
ncbi:MAG: hypothetical protein AB3N20_16150 [Rhizobiaceae bacterium]